MFDNIVYFKEANVTLVRTDDNLKILEVNWWFENYKDDRMKYAGMVHTIHSRPYKAF